MSALAHAAGGWAVCVTMPGRKVVLAGQLVAVVDTSGFADRFTDAPRRSAEREAAWKALLARHGIDALFVRLAQPDVAAAAASLAAALEHRS
jgi:hypothetical protein